MSWLQDPLDLAITTAKTVPTELWQQLKKLNRHLAKD